MSDEERIQELIDNLAQEEMPFRPKLMHGYATANAEVAKAVLFMLIKGKKEEDIQKVLFGLYGYKKETVRAYIERANVVFDLLKAKYPKLKNGIKNVTPEKKALPNKQSRKKKDSVPSTHVNADGSMVEMEDVLSKEEESASEEVIKEV